MGTLQCVVSCTRSPKRSGLMFSQSQPFLREGSSSAGTRSRKSPTAFSCQKAHASSAAPAGAVAA